MPPHKPIEDIEWPDLGDKFVDLLRALWKLVTNVFTVLWSYVSHAFCAIWTYPPFEAFRNEFVAALIGLTEYVAAHPLIAVAIFVLAFVFIPAVLSGLWMSLLRCMEFRKRDVLRGSLVTSYQSTSYGGNVPRTFARTQSQGAKGGDRYRVVASSGSSSWN